MIGDIFDDKINILLYFVFLIICFFYNILVWQIIDIFSPNHYCIAKVFEGFAVLLLSNLKTLIHLFRVKSFYIIFGDISDLEKSVKKIIYIFYIIFTKIL